jgi:hypothetical protein
MAPACDQGLTPPRAHCGTLAATSSSEACHDRSQQDRYHVPAAFAAHANLRHRDYVREYQASIDGPDAFWGRIAQRIDWMRAPTRIKDVSFHADDFRIRWYDDGELNASVSCLDRHLDAHGDKRRHHLRARRPGHARRSASPIASCTRGCASSATRCATSA